MSCFIPVFPLIVRAARARHAAVGRRARGGEHTRWQALDASGGADERGDEAAVERFVEARAHVEQLQRDGMRLGEALATSFLLALRTPALIALLRR